MTKTKDLIKQLKNQSILYIWSYPGYSHHFISWKQLPLFTKCSLYISVYRHCQSYISHSVSDSNPRIMFSCTIFSFRCHMELASMCTWFPQFSWHSEIWRKLLFHDLSLGCQPWGPRHSPHSNVCRDSAPSAVCSLFSHQDPAGTCFCLSKGKGQGGRGGRQDTWGKPIQTRISGYTGHATKAVHNLLGAILSRRRPRISSNRVSNLVVRMAMDRLLAKHS